MDNIKFTPQDILHKQFKERNIGKGYDEADVDSFLDDVIKDYDTFNKKVDRLNSENERLRAKVDELNRQVEVGSSMNNIFGFEMSAMAIDRRRCMPPDKCLS